MLWSVSGSRACRVNTGVFGGAFSCTTACIGRGRLMKYGGSSFTSLTCMMTRWLSVSANTSTQQLVSTHKHCNGRCLRAGHVATYWEITWGTGANGRILLKQGVTVWTGLLERSGLRYVPTMWLDEQEERLRVTRIHGKMASWKTAPLRPSL